MCATDLDDQRAEIDDGKKPDLVSRDFMRLITVWSIVPAWLIGGAFLGWLFTLWLPSTYPYAIGVGLVLGLVMSVRDVLRIRDTL
jgi:F0F1-type ATP synthase assembly protein I